MPKKKPTTDPHPDRSSGMALGPMDWLVVEAPLVGFINTINMMVNEIWFKYSWYYKIYDGFTTNY